jgi:hypothetical protein
VNVTVQNTGLSAINCTVGAYFNESYDPNWVELGAQTVNIPPSTTQTLSFDWIFDGSITERSQLRRSQALGGNPWYGSWEGLAVKAIVMANSGNGTDHSDELIGATVIVKMPGDGNADGKVNYVDLGVIASSYGSEPGDGNWNSEADYNCSDKVNYVDLGLIAANYGTTY